MMPNSHRVPIEAAKNALLDTVAEFTTEKHHLIFDRLREINNRSLIVLDSILRFYCADAVIRLLGIKKPDQVTNWWPVIEAGERFLTQPDPLERLSKLWLQTNNHQAFEIFLRYLVDRIKTRNELQVRLETLPVGKHYFRHWTKESDKGALDDLLTVIESHIRAWKSKQWKNKQVKTVHLSLRKDPEALSDALAVTYKAFLNQIEKLKDFETDTFPLSPLAEILPIPAWDRAAPGIMRQDIKDHVLQLLPILEGSMEEVPLKIYDAHLTAFRRRQKQLWNEPFSIDTMQQNEPKEDKRDDIINKLDADNLLRSLDGILENEGSRKADKIRLAFEFMRAGYSQEEAALRSGVSDRTLRSYIKKLRDIIK
jgi:hypothetical protein